MGNMGGATGGAYPPHDVRGQGGGNRDSYHLPNENLSRAEYAEHIDEELEGKREPSFVERFKRWFSARF